MNRFFFLALACLGPAAEAATPDGDTALLVIDAGSSGSRLKIFHWTPGLTPSYKQYEPSDDDGFKLTPGISSQTPGKAAEDISSLLTLAESHVSAGALKTGVRVYIGATAGMRLLENNGQDQRWSAIREAVQTSKFILGKAITLTGEEEAVFGWLSASYLENGALPTDDGPETVGSLDLGGASTQAAFLPPSSVHLLANKFRVDISHNGIRSTSNTYANSWLRSGNDQAHTRMLLAECGQDSAICTSACHMKDFRFTEDLSAYGGQPAVDVTGSGDWPACYAKIKSDLLHLDYECLFGTQCAAAASYFPKPLGKSKWYAYAAFFYPLSDVGAVGWNDATSDLKLYETKGTEWCSGLGSKNATMLMEDPGYEKLSCFGTAHAYAILVDGYGFGVGDKENPDLKLVITRKINGTEASWAFGAALYYGQEVFYDYKISMSGDDQCVESGASTKLSAERLVVISGLIAIANTIMAFL